MRARYKPLVTHSHEFELDLAPLLAVMVKLVPVLLVSSAWVQIMNIESELPQVVKEAIARDPANDKEKIQVALEVHRKTGFKIVVWKGQQQQIQEVPPKGDQMDLQGLQLALQKVKAEYPQVFRIELAPDGNMTHQELVKIMDEARKCKDPELKFPVFDNRQQKEILTEFMFPEIVFSNLLEG